MFQTDKHEATITNVNFRKENHGDEKVAAVDISIALGASALLLDTFDKKLRKAFFEKPHKGDQQPLPIDGNNLTALALPYLREQKLDQKFEGYEVTLHSLLDHIEPLFFADVKVKLERVTFIEGGSIDLSLKVSTLIETDDDAPLLAAWRRGEVRVSLTPPSKAGEQDKPQQEAA
jgi:hypothetical protein